MLQLIDLLSGIWSSRINIVGRGLPRVGLSVETCIGFLQTTKAFLLGRSGFCVSFSCHGLGNHSIQQQLGEAMLLGQQAIHRVR